MKIAIMTDVNAGLDYVGYETNIICLRSSVNFKNESLVDGIDIKADEFYERIKNVNNAEDIPSTSAPSVQDIYDAINKCIAEGYTDIIHYPISFALSSTGETVMQIAEDEFKDKINVHVINTKTAAFIQGYIALEAKRMADEGYNVQEIIDHSKFLIENNQAYFVVDNLKYLVKNGRLSNAAGVLGTLFKIKPILELTKEGKIVTLEKVKIYKKAIDRVAELMLKYIENSQDIKLFAFHSIKLDAIEYVIEKIKEARPDITDIPIHYITPAVGAHIGAGVIGIVAFILK